MSFGKDLDVRGSGYSVKLDKENPWLDVKDKQFKVDLLEDSNFMISKTEGKSSVYLDYNENSQGNIKVTNGDTEIMKKGDEIIKIPSSNAVKSLSTIPIELISGNNDFLISNSGEMAESFYSSKNLFSDVAIKEKVYLDSDGNLKFPYIKYLNDNYPFKNSVSLTTPSNNRFYLDDATKNIIFPDKDVTNPLDSVFKSDDKVSILKSALENFPEDNSIKEKLSEILKQPWKYSPTYNFDIRNLEKIDDKYVNSKMGLFSKVMDTLKTDPQLQLDFLNHATIKTGDTPSTNFLDNIIKNINNDSVEKKFIDIYGFSVNDKDIFNDKYILYKRFNDYFPEYSILSDDEKLLFVDAGVSNNKQTRVSRGFSIDQVRDVLDSYYSQIEKNPVIFDKSYTLKAYNWIGGHLENTYPSAKNEAFINPSQEFTKNFDNSLIYNNDISPKDSILKDISDSSIDKSFYLFNTHGNENEIGFKHGYFFNFGQIAITDKEVSEALFKRYIDSSADPSKRNFGDNVIFFSSCRSADFIDNVKKILDNRLLNLGVNPSSVKFPTMMSLSSQNDDGVNPGILNIIPNYMKNGQFTIQDFINMKANLQKSGNLNSPTLWYNQINNVNPCKIENGQFCRGL